MGVGEIGEQGLAEDAASRESLFARLPEMATTWRVELA